MIPFRILALLIIHFFNSLYGHQLQQKRRLQ